MTTRDVTAIVLRLFSLWLLVQVISDVPHLVMLLTSFEHYQGQMIPRHIYLMLIASFIFIGLLSALVIWIVARSALTRCASEECGDLEHQGQMFLLQLGGVYFIVTALAYLPKSLAFLSYSPDLAFQNFLRPAGLVFQLCIGLALMTRSSQWARLLARLRGRV